MTRYARPGTTLIRNTAGHTLTHSRKIRATSKSDQSRRREQGAPHVPISCASRQRRQRPGARTALTDAPAGRAIPMASHLYLEGRHAQSLDKGFFGLATSRSTRRVSMPITSEVFASEDHGATPVELG